MAVPVGRARSARLAFRHGKVNQLNPEFSRSRRRPRTVMLFVATACAVMFGISANALSASASASKPNAVQDPAPHQNSGTTIDPLQYNCGNNAPTCGQVGESNGYYNGTNVDLLYTENYFCDANISSNASTGCEAGAPQSGSPSANSLNGTTLGNTT